MHHHYARVHHSHTCRRNLLNITECSIDYFDAENLELPNSTESFYAMSFVAENFETSELGVLKITTYVQWIL